MILVGFIRLICFNLLVRMKDTTESANQLALPRLLVGISEVRLWSLLLEVNANKILWRRRTLLKDSQPLQYIGYCHDLVVSQHRFPFELRRSV